MRNPWNDGPLSFRVKPDGPVVQFTGRQLQFRRLARYLHEQRKLGRNVFGDEIRAETGIQEYKGRISEMRAMGFDIEKFDQPNPAKGDRRKLFRLSVEVELCEGHGDAS